MSTRVYDPERIGTRARQYAEALNGGTLGEPWVFQHELHKLGLAVAPLDALDAADREGSASAHRTPQADEYQVKRPAAPDLAAGPKGQSPRVR